MKNNLSKFFLCTIFLLNGCATKIEIVDEGKIETTITKVDAVLFGKQFIAKGTKLRVRSFKNGIRAVSFGTANQNGGGVLFIGGLPAFIPINDTVEYLFEIDAANCLTGKNVGFDSIFRQYLLSDDKMVTPAVLNPPSMCFDAVK